MHEKKSPNLMVLSHLSIHTASCIANIVPAGFIANPNENNKLLDKNIGEINIYIEIRELPKAKDSDDFFQKYMQEEVKKYIAGLVKEIKKTKDDASILFIEPLVTRHEPFLSYKVNLEGINVIFTIVYKVGFGTNKDGYRDCIGLLHITGNYLLVHQPGEITNG
jgi:hypothetical protein